MIRSFEPDNGKSFTAEKAREIISRDDFLTRQFKKVTILVQTPRYTLIPAQLFDPAKKEKYFALNFSTSESETILTNKLNNPDVFLAFSYSRKFNELVESFFPQASKTHSLKPLLTNLAETGKNSSGNFIQLNIENGYFNLVIYRLGSLIFCNSFEYRNTTDILYYALNTLNKLETGREETILLSGLCDRNDALFSGLISYYTNIRFSALPGKFALSYVFGDLPEHRYLNLFLAAGCE
jgi:hypothetical protein